MRLELNIKPWQCHILKLILLMAPFEFAAGDIKDALVSSTTTLIIEGGLVQ